MTTATCSTCGSPAEGGRLGGACPVCLLGLGRNENDATAASAPNGPPRIRPEPERRLGPFILEAEIARGGMGVVYRARQAGLDRPVALKCLAASTLAAPEMWLRFQVEVSAISRLDHPHIVPLYDFGEDAGVPYFTMKLVKGGTLADRLALRPGDGGWSRAKLRQLVGWLEAVCQAVHHAHQRGILHRDLKPSNILIDDDEHPLVSDFGLAKLTAEPAGLTRSVGWLGSPNYMAPEQLTAGPDTLTLAVDVYGLGAILFEFLTGRPPFAGGSTAETLRRLVAEPAPSARSLNPDADRDLENICRRCLEPEPARRYPSAESLAADLQRWLCGRPVTARPLRWPVRIWRWARRNPGVAAASVAALLATATGGAVAARHAARIRLGEAQNLELLQRLELGEAEQRFNHQRPAEGLAWLAHVLRSSPEDRDLRARLESALVSRRHSRPAFAPRPHPAIVLAIGANEAAKSFWSLDALGTLRHWALDDGRLLSTQNTGHDRVTAAAVSADQRWLALAGRPSALPAGVRLEVWQTWAGATDENGTSAANSGMRRMAELKVPNDEKILGLAIDAFGRQVAAFAGDPAAAWLWDVSASAIRQQFSWAAATSGHGDFSPDGRWLATSLRNGQVGLADLTSGDTRMLKGQEGGFLMAVRFDPASARVVYGGSENIARLTNLSGSQDAAPSFAHDSAVGCADFSADGTWLATGSGDNLVRIWEVGTGRLAFEPLTHPNGLTQVRLLREGQGVLSVTHDGHVWYWPLRREFSPPVELTLAARGRPGAFLGNDTVVIGDERGSVRSWAADTGRELGSTDGIESRDNGPLYSLDVAPGGGRVAAAWLGMHAQVISWGSAKPVVLRHFGWVRAARFDPSGERVVTASHDRTARVWDAGTGTPLTPPLPHGDEVYEARFSPDGQWVVTGSRDTQARIWDPRSGKLLLELPHQSWVASAKFNPRSDQLATACYDQRARLWPIDLNSPDRSVGEPLVLRHSGEVFSLDFSPDGRWLVTGSADQTARVWSTTTGQPEPWVLRHAGAIWQTQFSPDGRWILTVSRDGTARVWSARHGWPITEPLRHDGGLMPAGFSPDGRRLLTVGDDARARIWWLPAPDRIDASVLVDLAELVSGRRLTAAGEEEIVSANEVADLSRSLRARVEKRAGARKLVDWYLSAGAER